jgi:phage-related protein
MAWDIDYYSDDVQQSIARWPAGIRAYYARITERIMLFGPNLGMPFTKAMGDGLFEIRARGKEGIGRAFFCIVVSHKVVVLHAFVKKSQKTPRKELDLGYRRMAKVLQNLDK